jgi:hypothetical protein
MFPATGGVVAVGKNCDPTGVAVEQASNIARGTPTISAESRQLNTMPRHREVPEHAGPMRPGVPRAPLKGDEVKRNEAEGVSRADRKNRECGAMHKRVHARLSAKAARAV